MINVHTANSKRWTDNLPFQGVRTPPHSCVEEYFIELYEGKILKYSLLLAVLPRNLPEPSLLVSEHFETKLSLKILEPCFDYHIS